MAQLHRRRRFRWRHGLLIMVVTLLILTLAAAVLFLRSGMTPATPMPSPPPSIHQIRQMAALVTARLAISDIHQTSLRGRLGQATAVLAVRGEALLGPDLSAARIVAVDAAEREVRLELPRPRVISARLDHRATRVVAITHSGLWLMVPGDAGRTALINLAHAEAEHRLAQAANDPALIEQAAQQAERVLGEFFSSLGWRVSIRWSDGAAEERGVN